MTTHSTALELEDGKVLLAKSDVLRTIGWREITEKVGLSTLIGLDRDADANRVRQLGRTRAPPKYGMAWNGTFFRISVPDTPQMALSDLADSSRRTDLEFRRPLIGCLSAAFETVLCINPNEAFGLHAMLGAGEHVGDTEAAGAALFAAPEVDTLIVCHRRAATAWTRNNVISTGRFYVERPRVSTGGGDNFNGRYGFISALSSRALQGGASPRNALLRCDP